MAMIAVNELSGVEVVYGSFVSDKSYFIVATTEY